jgi:hypothetical protein
MEQEILRQRDQNLKKEEEKKRDVFKLKKQVKADKNEI